MIYRFAGFEIDVAQRELRRSGRTLHLQPRTFDLLVFLIRNRHRVVGKDELLEALWAGRVVEEGALHRVVSLVRTALREGDAADLVRTYARQGYRFTGEVEEQFLVAPGEADAPVSAAPRIAVLPFEYLGEDPERRFLGEGIAGDINTGLSAMRDLEVVSRASSFACGAKPSDLAQVFDDLDVRYVVLGNVRDIRGILRISVELAAMPAGTQIWAQKYDCDAEEIFAVQDEITDAIVAAVDPELNAFEAQLSRLRPPESLDAWSAYQTGLWHVYRFTRDDVVKAMPCFQRAVALDPHYAPAWAGISFVHFSNAYLGYTADASREAGLAHESASRAVELDSRCPRSHWALGRALQLQGNIRDAIGEFGISLKLSPSFAHGYYMLGWARALAGEPDAGEANVDRAELLSPRDPLLFAFDMVRAMCCLLRAEHERALQWSAQAMRRPGAHEHATAVHVAALAACGRSGDAREAARELLRRRPEYCVESFAQAMPYLAARDLATVTGRLAECGVPAHRARALS